MLLKEGLLQDQIIWMIFLSFLIETKTGSMLAQRTILWAGSK